MAVRAFEEQQAAGRGRRQLAGNGRADALAKALRALVAYRLKALVAPPSADRRLCLQATLIELKFDVDQFDCAIGTAAL